MGERRRITPAEARVAAGILGTSLAEADDDIWIAAFRRHPDAAHQLLADFIKHAYAKPGRIGQRPMPREEEVDLHSLVYGEDNETPLPEILPRLLGRVGTRELAMRVHMSRTQVQRMLRGEYAPTPKEMRTLASAIGKPPSFFIEYRRAMVLQAVDRLLQENPGYTTTLYRKYLEVRKAV